MFLSLFGGEPFAQDSQPSTLVFGEVDALAVRELLQDLFEDQDLFGLVVQCLVHPLIERAGDHDDEELQRCGEH